MFRSEQMHLLLFYFNKDTAKICLNEIGNVNLVHFLDLNGNKKDELLPFNDEIRRIERMSNRMQFLKEEVRWEDEVHPNKDYMYSAGNKFMNLNELEQEVEKHFTRLVQLKDIAKGSINSLKILMEDLVALEDLDQYLQHAEAPEFLDECKKNLQYLCLIVPLNKSSLLQRALYTKLRRNIIIEHNSHSVNTNFFVDASKSSDETHSFYVYLVFTHGEKAIKKVKEISEGLGCRFIETEMIEKGRLKLTAMSSEIQRVYNNNHQTMEEEIQMIRRNYGIWRKNQIRELRIYSTMNKLKTEKGHELLVGEGFVKSAELEKLRKVLGAVGTKGCFMGTEIVKCYGTEEEERNDYVMEIEEKEGEPNRENQSIKNKEIESSNNSIDCKYKEENVRMNENEQIRKKEIKVKNYQKKYDEGIFGKTKTNGIVSPSKNRFYGKLPDSAKLFSPLHTAIEIREIPDIKKPKHPPTYFKTNCLTSSFQDINNVYGIPMYKEINPGLFYISTFPFMFGCMFGDVGHGLILFFASYYMIRNEKKICVPEFLKMIFDGRYIMLLCSIWAIFFGFIYSDFMSLPLPIFPSAYHGSQKSPFYTYPIGIDPAWHHSEKIGMLFMNSLKMKMSIILGFFHMSLGVVLGFFNVLHRGDKIYCYCVWIPQSLSFFAFVGYIVFLIFYKWLVTFDRPSLISVLVNMYTSPFDVPDPMFSFQKEVQLFLLSLIIISIPWMLLSRPIYATLHARKRIKKNSNEEGLVEPIFSNEEKNLSLNFDDNETIYASTSNSNHKKVKRKENGGFNEHVQQTESFDHQKIIPEENNVFDKENEIIKKEEKNKGQNLKIKQNKISDGIEEEKEEVSLVDIWMHQCIDTIEFGIGLISNTSSYLRLWAISLAHSQLTSVLHSMTIGSKNIYVKVFSFPVWLFFTIALLVGLEGLSACLHALRLNWIEFNGKFYKGGGYLFEPLNFEEPNEE